MSSSQPALVPGLQRPARDRGQAGQGDPAGDRRARRRRGGAGFGGSPRRRPSPSSRRHEDPDTPLNRARGTPTSACPV